MNCLVAASRISEATGGAFDPAYASTRAEGQDSLFALDRAAHTLTSLTERLHLDLGAVGKGYALDQMAGVLRDWDVDVACLQSGGSTVLALAAEPDSAGWLVAIAGDDLPIAHRAVSASGTAVQGAHVIDPRSGKPCARPGRVWSFANSAAVADALSTAFFVMGDAEISAFCQRHSNYAAAILREDGRTTRIGSD